MIVKDRTTKGLVVPKSLGNFNNNGGGEGGGVTPEQAAEIASAITESAISAYDVDIQEDFGELREAISSNTQDISAVSAQTSANTAAIETLSGVSADVESLSAQTSANTADIETLSGLTNVLTGITNIQATRIAELSGATTANTSDIETLSALTNAVAASGDVVYDYDEISGLTINEKQAIWTTINSEYKSKKVWIRKKRVYMGQIPDVQWFLCYHSDTPFQYFVAVDRDNIYRLAFHYNGGTLTVTDNKIHPVATDSTLGEIKVGSGLTIDSGGTLSVSGGAGGSGDYIITPALSGITNPTEGQMATVKSTTAATIWTKIQISDYQSFTENTGGVPENFLARIHWGDWDSSTQGEEDLLALNVYQSGPDFYWGYENNGIENVLGVERDGVYYNIAYRTHNDVNNNANCYFLFRQIDQTPYGDFKIQIRDYVGSAETIETKITPGGTYVYTQGKWTTINSIYYLPKYGFDTSGETISFVQNIKADCARGRYPQLYHRGFIFNIIGIGETFISFENMHTYNTDWIVYLSDIDGLFGDNGFNEAGYRFDQGAIVNDPDIGTICVYVGPNGDFWYQHRGARELYSETTLCRVAVKGCESDFSAEYGFGSIIYARMVTVSDVTTYTWSLIVPTDTGVMKGVWHTTNIDDGSTYVLDSWTSI